MGIERIQLIESAWWDACTNADLSPELANPNLQVWVGVDASVKRDSTAIVAVTFDRTARKARLVWHRIFQPSPEDPLDFKATIERTLLELRRRFYLKEVRFDPFQLVAVAQRLTNQRLPMLEFAQSVPNLTEASTNLYELVKGHNISVYPDDEIRLAVSRAVALETTRGWRITKEKQSHKIDVIVALAEAALGAVQGGQQWVEFAHEGVKRVGGISEGFNRVGDGSRLYMTGADADAAEDAQQARQMLSANFRRAHFNRRAAW